MTQITQISRKNNFGFYLRHLRHLRLIHLPLSQHTTSTDNAPIQTAISPYRIYAAVETEIPIPVPSAMYAAMHNGHFGINANITPGIAHSITVRPEHSHLDDISPPSSPMPG